MLKSASCSVMVVICLFIMLAFFKDSIPRIEGVLIMDPDGSSSICK